VCERESVCECVCVCLRVSVSLYLLDESELAVTDCGLN